MPERMLQSGDSLRRSFIILGTIVRAGIYDRPQKNAALVNALRPQKWQPR